MKYTIETTEDGCVETLELSDGKRYVKNTKKIDGGCSSVDDDLDKQMEQDGICAEILERVYEQFDGIHALDFLELAELDC